MKLWIKIPLWIVGALVIVVAMAWGNGERVLAQRVELPAVAAPEVSFDEASLARGEHLARAVSGCADCHAPDLGGNPEWALEPGLLPTPNLTPGGVGADYSEEDWARALREGIAADGRRLLIMPSQAYAAMSDDDLGDLIAFLMSVPAVEREIPQRDGRFLASLLVGIGGFPTADQLAGDVVPMETVEAVDAAYGEYLTTIADCAGCHGPNLAGNPGPGGAPGVNITPGGDVDEWTSEEFLALFRTALRPDGTTVEQMPIADAYVAMSDDEIEAIRLYLLSLPELEDEGP